MGMVYRAADVPVGARIEHWERVAEKAPIRLTGRFAHGPEIECAMRTGSMGPVGVTEMNVAAAECFRSAKMIRRSDPELYSVEFILYGSVLVEQDGRRARLWPGDFTVTDSSRPVRYAHTATRAVIVTVPHRLLPLRQDEVARLTATRIPGDRGAGALVANLARQLPRYLDDAGIAEGVRLGTALLDLLTVALSARLDPGEPADDGQHALLRRVHAYIDERLTDPELTPGTIAAAHHISVRYLHRLFESHEVTVAGWIRCRRLERCRRDLLDPALRDRPVSSIAARWGFVSPAHFNRVFRDAYGVPPGEYRLTASSDVTARPA